MELALLLLVAVALATAWGAMSRPGAHRIPSEDHGRADEDGPVITLTDYRDRDRSATRWLLPALAAIATLAAAVTAVLIGADL